MLTRSAKGMVGAANRRRGHEEGAAGAGETYLYSSFHRWGEEVPELHLLHPLHLDDLQASKAADPLVRTLNQRGQML